MARQQELIQHMVGQRSEAAAESDVLFGGEVLVADDDDAMIEERPVKVPDLMATVFDRLGIDHEKEYMSPNGRPLALANKGKPIKEAIG